MIWYDMINMQVDSFATKPYTKPGTSRLNSPPFARHLHSCHGASLAASPLRRQGTRWGFLSHWDTPNRPSHSAILLSKAMVTWG